jgi:hypothetical protein
MVLGASLAFASALAAGDDAQGRRGRDNAAKAGEAAVDARLLTELEILRDLELLRQLDVLRKVEEVLGGPRSPTSREEKGKP